MKQSCRKMEGEIYNCKINKNKGVQAIAWVTIWTIFGDIYSLREPLRAIRSNLEPNGAIWRHLELYGAIWSHLELFGAILAHFKKFGAIKSGEITRKTVSFEKKIIFWGSS